MANLTLQERADATLEMIRHEIVALNQTATLTHHRIAGSRRRHG